MSLPSERGRAGEAAALRHLQGMGYGLLAQNFRFRAQKIEALSEIDLILLTLDESLLQDDEETKEARALLDRELHEQKELEPLSKNTPLPENTPLVLVFVEVKNWRRIPLGDLALNLTEARQRRMFRTAECFLECYPRYSSLKRRFDLFAFQNAAEPLHIKAAFP